MLPVKTVILTLLEYIIYYIRKIFPQKVQSAVTCKADNVLNVSKFGNFLYIPLLTVSILHLFGLVSSVGYYYDRYVCFHCLSFKLVLLYLYICFGFDISSISYMDE